MIIYIWIIFIWLVFINNIIDEESSINKKYLNFENKLVNNVPNINLTSLETTFNKKNKSI